MASFWEIAAYVVNNMFPSLCQFVAVAISHFGFEGETFVLIASVLGHCLPLTFQNERHKQTVEISDLQTKEILSSRQQKTKWQLSMYVHTTDRHLCFCKFANAGFPLWGLVQVIPVKMF